MAKKRITLAKKKAAVSWNLDDVVKEFKEINKDSEEVLRRTTADFATRGPAWVSKGVTEVYNVKKKRVKEALEKINRKTGKTKIAGKVVDNTELIYEGHRLALNEFSLRPSKQPTKREPEYRTIPIDPNSRQYTKGKVTTRPLQPGELPFLTVRPLAPYKVSSEIQKGKRKTYTGPMFVFNNGRGGIMAFQRKSEERASAAIKRGPSVAAMIDYGPGVRKKVEKYIDEGMSKRLEHHVDRILAKK